jgi:ATPase subunit of ABC transporter with duplicated ATPase domains
MPSGARVLTVNAAEVEIGGRRFGPWSLQIAGPERISLAGPNGTGKTTFLKLAVGALTPSRGTAERAEGRVVMLDQHVALLDRDRSVLDNIRRQNPALSAEEAHAICARFAFRNRDALRIVGTLSGGELMRAGLAAAFAGTSPPWLLILDEPTNHLDIDSIESLEQALRDYDGALLIVSHDAAFLERVGIDRELTI